MTIKSSYVFCGKTQGALSHIPLLGIACMIVDMLPEGSADVFGDINLAQCKKAIKWVNETLGKEVQLSALLILSLEAKDKQFGEFLNEHLFNEVYLYYRNKFTNYETDMSGFRTYLHEYLQMGLSFEGFCKMLVQIQMESK